MNFTDFDYVNSNKFTGKIILTSFPGSDKEGKFNEELFLLQLDLFKNNNCSSIVSFVEDKEFEILSGKNYFVKKVYQHQLNWHHLPISDLNAPNNEFKLKWETTKILLKNELLDGKNIILHCRGGKGRAGIVAALLLIDFGMKKEEAIHLVRSRRKGAIETKKQEEFIFSYRP
tara:strand:+ start:368 stop:886 length:519 start_codon:yes stop_codon:yes gene_type:complete